MSNKVTVSTTTNTVTITPQQNTGVSIGTTNTPITVNQGSTSVVQIQAPGVKGNTGPTGPIGPQGPTQDTGSLLTTASYSNPNLTLTKGDGSTFNVGISTTTPTLAEVTSQGSSTTTAITASIISASGDISASSLRISNPETSSQFIQVEYNQSDDYRTRLTVDGPRVGTWDGGGEIMLKRSITTPGDAGTLLLSGFGSTGNNTPHIQANGAEIVFANALQPNGNKSYDLGSTSRRWNNIYIDGINASGNITASNNISASGNLSGSSLYINGTTKNIIASTNGFRVSGYTDLKYLENTGNNTLQWRTNGDAIFEIRSQNGSNNDTYIHFEHATTPGPQNVSVGVCQDSGSFIIARDEGFAENNDFTITGSNGFIGINDPNPTERLTVSGNISASGTGSFAQMSLPGLPTADPGIAGRLFTTQSTGTGGNLDGQKILLVSAG